MFQTSLAKEAMIRVFFYSSICCLSGWKVDETSVTDRSIRWKWTLNDRVRLQDPADSPEKADDEREGGLAGF